MRDGVLKYPKWEREFQDTILEFDRDKLPEKAQRFETAVSARLQELASDSDHHDEREANYRRDDYHFRLEEIQV